MDTPKKSDDEENKGCNESDPMQNEEAKVETSNLSNPFVSPTMVIKRWSDVPDNLMQQIADELSFEGYMNLTKISARYKELECNKRDILNFSRNGFWTLIYDFNGLSFLYSPNYARSICLKIEELQGSTVLLSKEQWLLVHKNDNSLSLFNLFSARTIRLPEANLLYEKVEYFIKSLPGEVDDCVVSVIEHLGDTHRFQSCSLAEMVWRPVEVLSLDTPSFETFSYTWKQRTIRMHSQNWRETFANGLHLKMNECRLFVRGNGMPIEGHSIIIEGNNLNTEEFQVIKSAVLKPF